MSFNVQPRPFTYATETNPKKFMTFEDQEITLGIDKCTDPTTDNFAAYCYKDLDLSKKLEVHEIRDIRISDVSANPTDGQRGTIKTPPAAGGKVGEFDCAGSYGGDSCRAIFVPNTDKFKLKTHPSVENANNLVTLDYTFSIKDPLFDTSDSSYRDVSGGDDQDFLPISGAPSRMPTTDRSSIVVPLKVAKEDSRLSIARCRKFRE